MIELQFEWLNFDGDDCFSDFHIDVKSAKGNRRFDFGECAVNGLRKLSRFIRSETEGTVGGGFRCPDVRYYHIYREKDGYRLKVRFESSGLQEEIRIHNPEIEIDDELMRAFYQA